MITSLVTSSGLTVFMSERAEAQTTPKISQWSAEESLKSYVYYKALSYCISNYSLHDGSWFAANSRIDVNNASSGNWFRGGLISQAVSIGYLLYGTNNASENTQDVKCSDNSWIQQAAALWGYSSPLGILCSAIGLHAITTKTA